MKFLPYLKIIRAPAGFTALSNILAAATITTAANLPVNLYLIVLASICFYFAGMALNDCFDYQEDLAERPTRPLPSGEIAIKNAWLFAFTLLLLGNTFAYCYSISVANMSTSFIGLALSASILLYNSILKNGFIGSICMASCRYLNWLLGASVIALVNNSYYIALPIFFYIVALTYLSKQETLGENKNSVYFAAIMLLLCAATCIALVLSVFNLTNLQQYIAFALIIAWTALQLNKLRLVFADFTPKNIQKLIGWMVIGVIPLDALLVALAGHYFIAVIILALLPPCRILNKYLYVT